MSMIQVRDKMNRNAPVVKCGAALSDVVTLFGRHHVNSVPVVNENNEVLGLVAELDSLQALISGSYHCDKPVLVNEVMTNDVSVVSPQDSVIDIAIRMRQERYSAYPVVEGNVLVGMLSRQIILQVLASEHAQCSQV